MFTLRKKLPVSLAVLIADSPLQLAVDEGRAPISLPRFLRVDTNTTLVTPSLEGLLHKTLKVVEPGDQQTYYLALKTLTQTVQSGYLSASDISACLLNIIATGAAYCLLDNLDEQYHASELHAWSGIPVLNDISDMLEFQLGIPMEADVGDDEDIQQWTSLIHLCTDRERAKLAIQVTLQLLQPVLPEEEKLFISVPYLMSLENWLSHRGCGRASAAVIWTETGLRNAAMVAGADSALWNLSKVADELPLLEALQISADPGRQAIIRIR